MSAWPGKYVIGLTGNIATGKSVVRKMLEHLGAYGIDADALSHRAIALGAPGYGPAVEQFGKWILQPDGQIDRARLSRVVFADPEALSRLEAIIHPLVRQAVDVLVRRSSHKVVVIEAIKLLESPLLAGCDSLWVTAAAPDTQLARLVQKRSMPEGIAHQRITVQASQDVKIAAADVVIYNDGSFDDTWQQVTAAWQKKVPGAQLAPAAQARPAKGVLSVEHGRPRHAEEIVALINRLSMGQRNLSRADIMAAFGEKAFMLLRTGGQLVGLAGWKVENLVARTGDFYFEPDLVLAKALRLIMEEVERSSRELQCEISLMFLPPELTSQEAIWKSLGYQPRTPQSLGVSAWQEAAQESMPPGSTLFFKQLRKDRVLRPV